MLEILLLAGWAFEVAAGEREAALAETEEALERWIGLGLGYAQAADGARLFDPVEVVNFIKCAGFRGDDGFWEERFVRTGRALVAGLEASTGLKLACPTAADRTHRFNVHIKRTFNSLHLPRNRKVRLKLPLPLVSHYLADLQVDVVATAPGAKTTISAGRLDVLLPVDHGGEDVTLAANVSFDAKNPVGAWSDGLHPVGYANPHEGLIQVTNRVRSVASRLRDVDTQGTVDAFWSHLLDNFACGPIHYDLIGDKNPMDWVLDNGWYDCQLGAAILISLCRSVDIPARLVGGHVLYDLAPTNHFWAEIWFPDQGWRPYDLLSWDLSLGGTAKAWRDAFHGQCDHRMVTELFPDQFTGPMTLQTSKIHQMVQTTFKGSLRVDLCDVSSRSIIYSDDISFI